MIHLGPYLTLHSEAVLVDALASLGLTLSEVRILLRRLSVPTLHIRDIRFFNPLTLMLALSTALQPGAPDFFISGSNRGRNCRDRLRPEDITSYYRTALGQSALAAALADDLRDEGALITALRKAGAQLAAKVFEDSQAAIVSPSRPYPRDAAPEDRPPAPDLAARVEALSEEMLNALPKPFDPAPRDLPLVPDTSPITKVT